eukprot:gene7584-7709_t
MEDRSISQRNKVGGFHESKIPLAEEAKSALKSMGKNQCAVLAISADLESLIVENMSPCSSKLEDIQSQIDKEQPRFYVISVDPELVIYCCPDNAARKYRMLYSTAKANTIKELKAIGFSAKTVLEISEFDDLDCYNIRGKAPPQPSSKETKRASRPSAETIVPSAVGGSLSQFMAKSLGKSAMADGKKRNTSLGSVVSKEITMMPDFDRESTSTREDDDVIMTGEYGSFTWESALVLEAYVQSIADQIRGATVIELGCGTAAPGKRAEEQGFSDIVSVVPLDWGTILGDEHGIASPLYIIASDCFYDYSDYDNIFCTVVDLLEKYEGCFISAYHVRTSRSFQHTLVQWNLSMEEICIPDEESNDEAVRCQREGIPMHNHVRLLSYNRWFLQLLGKTSPRPKPAHKI